MFQYQLAPPRRCAGCATNFVAYLQEDRERMRAALLANPRKLSALRRFLALARTRTLSLAPLDPELRRVLS
ncbi:MC105L [Molluscum contagiosum virus subtype 1]|uniref:B1-60-2 protein n=3 Tax=Molluscum contagiosum virus TaxID=10279 RepID=Q98272_MCV1|nr:MC105L [Molluscum contagiosum virus subtype 1]AZT86348.1 MC105L [Molluscum contagiosum virus]AAB57992.1 similar to variola A3L and vaccinia WR [Molluscum contagiosum virus subtype 1]AAC55233.1 MC105L [Molluscum contagiosum virus subtype 1]AQY16854.1 MC105 [Molluscum contagiosum virus subtype 1]AQY17033.1 MC105 [Molluscum contagiosum virus subtype 1]